MFEAVSPLGIGKQFGDRRGHGVDVLGGHQRLQAVAHETACARRRADADAARKQRFDQLDRRTADVPLRVDAQRALGQIGCGIDERRNEIDAVLVQARVGVGDGFRFDAAENGQPQVGELLFQPRPCAVEKRENAFAVLRVAERAHEQQPRRRLRRGNGAAAAIDRAVADQMRVRVRQQRDVFVRASADGIVTLQCGDLRSIARAAVAAQIDIVQGQQPARTPVELIGEQGELHEFDLDDVRIVQRDQAVEFAAQSGPGMALHAFGEGHRRVGGAVAAAFDQMRRAHVREPRFGGEGVERALVTQQNEFDAVREADDEFGDAPRAAVRGRKQRERRHQQYARTPARLRLRAVIAVPGYRVVAKSQRARALRAQAQAQRAPGARDASEFAPVLGRTRGDAADMLDRRDRSPGVAHVEPLRVARDHAFDFFLRVEAVHRAAMAVPGARGRTEQHFPAFVPGAHAEIDVFPIERMVFVRVGNVAAQEVRPA